jgi:putative transposase
MPDRVQLFVRAGPINAPMQVLSTSEGRTAHVLRQEFPHLRRFTNVLWSRPSIALGRIFFGVDGAPLHRAAVGRGGLVRRAYVFPLRPTTRQHVALETCLESHRELYNAALQERRDAWSHSKTRINYGDQSAQLSEIRSARPDQAVWSFSSQQATLRRLNKAFGGFFRRIARGQRAGYPRFKGKARFDSVEWPKDGDGARWLPEQNRVYLQGVGEVKVDVHRPVQGRVKTIQIKRQGRRWVLVLSCDDVPTNPLPATDRPVGIDVGIASFATTSDGRHIENPRWGRAAADKLAAAQRRLARAKRRSKNRDRRRETVAARHRKIANQRKDFHHKQARSLVESYDLLVVEDLRIANMLGRAKPVPDPDNPGQYLANGARAKSGLNRSISDAGWGRFTSMLRAKAEDAGRTWIEVDPRHTSDGCEKWGYAAAENRITQAEFECQRCSHRTHADEHAARNILRAGLAHHARAA